MKYSVARNILLLLALLAACGPPVADRRPLLFVAYEKNPILGTGIPGDWDTLSANTPDVVFDDSVFYLFYTGSNRVGNMSVGVAISYDGYHFTKYSGNPVFSPANTGFDAYAAGATRTIKINGKWLMFYNALEISGFSPGPCIGKAEATLPTGPWIRSEIPILTTGKKGEWDDGFIIPGSVVVKDDGSYMMFYTGGREYHTFKDFCLGMAISKDGISWKKYNDLSTTEHPFRDSDPVLFPGKGPEWDNSMIWISDIKLDKNGFKMYYTGINVNEMVFTSSVGFATSNDGIRWNKYQGNPVFTAKDDPFTQTFTDQLFIENPCIIHVGNQYFMYYDYGGGHENIGVAIAGLKN